MAERLMTKRDQIVIELRRHILSGGIARGDRMRQEDLAVRFNSSITPVREALRALEAEGLVVSAPHRGVRVSGVDLERVKGLYVARRLTESYATTRAASRISRHELVKAEELLDDLETNSRAGNDVERNELTFRFHCFFYERAGLPGLSADIVTRWQAFPWDLTLGDEARRAESAKEHRQILEAVRSGDEQLAGRLMGVHISHGFQSVAAQITGEIVQDPFDVDVD